MKEGQYRIKIRRSAARALEQADRQVRGRLIAAIRRLGTDPYPAQSTTLKGAPGFRRIRVGPYRVVYRVTDLTVEVARIGHRRDVYQRLRDLR